MIAPLVTVSVASYNHARFIQETLNSVYNQRYPNVELVIVDDKSEDDSIDIITTWLKTKRNRFTNVKFIQNETNKGICRVANQMIENASGQYISLLASDDHIMPDKLVIQVELLEKSADDVALVYSDAYLMKEDGTARYGWFIQTCYNYVELPSGNIFNDLLVRNFLPTMTILVKKDVFNTVGGFDESLKYEDWDMWLRIAKTYKVIFSDYVSARYRMHNGSLSHTINWLEVNPPIFKKHAEDSDIAKGKLIDTIKQLYDEKNYSSVIKHSSDVKNLSKTINFYYRMSALKVPPFLGNRFFKFAFSLKR